MEKAREAGVMNLAVVKIADLIRISLLIIFLLCVLMPVPALAAVGTTASAGLEADISIDNQPENPSEGSGTVLRRLAGTFLFMAGLAMLGLYHRRSWKIETPNWKID
jgi:hypothetical protein